MILNVWPTNGCYVRGGVVRGGKSYAKWEENCPGGCCPRGSCPGRSSPCGNVLHSEPMDPRVEMIAYSPGSREKLKMGVKTFYDNNGL